MNVGLAHRAMLRRLNPALEHDLEALIAGLVAGWLKEHRADDTHGDITADSVLATNSPRFTSYLTVTINANQHNFAPPGYLVVFLWRVNCSGVRTITGLAGGVSGRWIRVHNVGSGTMLLDSENTNSLSRNRIRGSAVIPKYGSVDLVYDGLAARWIV